MLHRYLALYIRIMGTYESLLPQILNTYMLSVSYLIYSIMLHNCENIKLWNTEGCCGLAVHLHALHTPINLSRILNVNTVIRLVIPNHFPRES
jgi:hypothetical protein